MKIISMAGAILAALTAVAATTSSAASNSFSPKTLVATQAAAADANRVVVLRVESLGPSGARAVIVRRPSGTTTQDFILVNASTRPADLAKAVATLMFSHRKQGTTLTRELRAEIAAATTSAGPQSRDSQRASRDLARLAAAKVVSIPGVGRGPAIGITTAKVAVSQKKK